MRTPFTLLLVGCASAPTLPITGTTSVETFPSAIVEDDYLLRVRLPPDVDASASWPLVIQLDPTAFGLNQYDTTVGLVSQRAAEGLWPDAVVVGVDYENNWAGRERDYTPPDPVDPTFAGEGADRFYRVLRDEILPHLDATLPVDPARRIVVGHSNGAVFAWYTTFRHEGDGAPLFAGAVAADAGIGQGLFTYERLHAERSDTLPVRLYASHALYNGASQEVTFEGLVTRLADRAFPDLALQTERLDTDHGGSVVPSYEAGLAFTLAELP